MEETDLASFICFGALQVNKIYTSKLKIISIPLQQQICLIATILNHSQWSYINNFNGLGYSKMTQLRVHRSN